MRQLGLDRTGLARAAGIDRAVVAKVLARGPENVRAATRGKIERALRWAPGSLDGLTAGSHPDTIEDPSEINALAGRVATIEQAVVVLQRTIAEQGVILRQIARRSAPQ